MMMNKRFYDDRTPLLPLNHRRGKDAAGVLDNKFYRISVLLLTATFLIFFAIWSYNENILAPTLLSASTSMNEAITTLTSTSSLHSTSSSNSSTSSKPNFIVFMVDDLTWTSIYSEDAEMLPFTPNIRQLMKNGVTISQFYSQEVCTPSRASFLSGNYPSSIGAQIFNIEVTSTTGINPAVTFFPSILQQNDYETHLLGKWHLGHASPDYLPTARGFDTYLGYLSGEEYPWSKIITTNSSYTDLITMNSTCYTPYDGEDFEEYSTFLYRDRAIELIGNTGVKPFYLQIAFQAVHNPFIDTLATTGLDSSLINTTYLKIIEAISGTKSQEYAKALYFIDEAIGDIVEALRDSHIDDNTYIIFLTDHGGCYREGAKTGPLRGTKGTLFEGGTRVGAILAGGRLPDARRGSEFAGIMHISDWFPTILGLAEITNPSTDLDGVDQSAALFDASQVTPRTEMLYNCYTNITGYYMDLNTNASCGVRNQRYKLLHFWNTSSVMGEIHDTSEVEDDDDNLDDNYSCKIYSAAKSSIFSGYTFEKYLFDLENDPYESVNLYDSEDPTHRAIQEELLGLMENLATKVAAYDADGATTSSSAYATFNQHGKTVLPWTSSSTSTLSVCMKSSTEPLSNNN